MTTREPSTHRTHDAAWSFHLPCGRCGSTSEDMECVPTSPERDQPTCGAPASVPGEHLARVIPLNRTQESA